MDNRRSLVAILAILALVSPAIAQTNAFWTPRSELNIKALALEAVEHIRRQRPEVDSRNLSFESLNYGYQPMPSTRSQCGPTGCVESPRPPFSERIYVAFLLLDSKKPVDDMIEFQGLGVQFPSYDIPNIGIYPTSSKRSLEYLSQPVALPEQDLQHVFPINASNMLAVATTEARLQRPDIRPEDLLPDSLGYHFDYNPEIEVHMQQNGTRKVIIRRKHSEDITASLEILSPPRDATVNGRHMTRPNLLNVTFPHAGHTNFICAPGH